MEPRHSCRHIQHREKSVPTRHRNARISADILIDKIHVRGQKIQASTLFLKLPSAVSVAGQLSLESHSSHVRPPPNGKGEKRKKKEPRKLLSGPCTKILVVRCRISFTVTPRLSSLGSSSSCILHPSHDFKDGHIIHIIQNGGRSLRRCRWYRSGYVHSLVP